MESIITKISIDLQSPATYEVIKAQQNDINTRVIEVALTNNGDKYLLDEIETIKFEGHRGDSSSFIHPCSYSDNIVNINLDENLLAIYGLYEGRIVMYDSNDNKILSTPSIKISVQKDPCLDKDNITELQMNAIDKLIIEIEGKFTKHIDDNDIHVTKEEHERYNSLFNDIASTEQPVNQKNGDFWTRLID